MTTSLLVTVVGMSDDEGKGDTVYGATLTIEARFIMAGGGSHWWHYVARVEPDNSVTVFIENKDGRQQQDSRLWFFISDEGSESIFLGDAPPQVGWMEVDVDFLRNMRRW